MNAELWSLLLVGLLAVKANATEPSYNVQSINNENQRWLFNAVNVYVTDKGVHVSGRLRPTTGNTVERGHVDLIAYNTEGKLIEETSANYYPQNSLRAQRNAGAKFKANFMESIPGGSTIKVVYHANKYKTASPHYNL